MKRPLRRQMEVQLHRIRLRAGEALREIGQALFLITAILLVTAVLLLGYDQLLLSPHLRVRETVVRGCKELTEKDILTLAAVGSRANLLLVSSRAVAGRVRANPWVQEAHVGKEFPNRLVIWVRERTAVALIEKGKELHLVDSGGTPFKRLETDEDCDLPVLTGFDRDGVVDLALVKRSLALLGEIRGMQGGPDIGTVSEIHGHKTFGLSVFTDTGLCLQLGFDGYEGKLKRLHPVMADLDRKNLKTGFLLIDLSDPAKVNVQRRNILEPASPKKSGGGAKAFRM